MMGEYQTSSQSMQGFRQGCLWSPFLFLVVLDSVSRRAYASSGKGIQWSLVKKLENLDFADYLALLSHRLQDLKGKIDFLEEVAKQVGLKISREKTKVMRINTKQDT